MPIEKKTKISIFGIVVILLIVGQGIKLLKKLADKPSNNNKSSFENRKILRDQILKDQDK